MDLKARQMEVVNKLTEKQKDIYSGIAMALQYIDGSDAGFANGLAAITALKTTMDMALEDAKADGHPGCPTEEHD